MVWHTRRGTPVDPVPFLVSLLVVFLLAFSMGPIYGLSYGLSLPLSLLATGVAVCAAAAWLYYQMVWTANPEIRGDLPLELRIHQLFYGVLLGLLVLVLLTLPFL